MAEQKPQQRSSFPVSVVDGTLQPHLTDEQLADGQVMLTNTVMQGFAVQMLGNRGPKIKLNEQETDLCEAINALWKRGVDWPGQADIVKESGYPLPTAKPLLAAMARHGILETGPGGRGYKVYAK